jgi:uncharacterized membrane protein
VSETYLLWKTAHIVSASVLFGSGLGTAFFCWFGYRVASGEIGGLRTTLKLTVLADLWLTTPAVVFQAASGIILVSMAGWSLTSAWSIAVWSMFLIVGACWTPMVAIQIRLRNAAIAAGSVRDLPAAFHRLFRIWFALGVPAFALTIVIFYVMVARPLAVG